MRALTTAAILREAKAILETQGWYQGADYNRVQYLAGVPLEECAVCLRGAVTLARFGNPVWDGTRIDALDLLNRLVDDDGVACWNDDPHRTLDEVLSLLDEAARLADAEAGAL